jgi:hypothetical protein
MKTETSITARSIKHRVNYEQLQRVLEAKKHRTFEDDDNAISRQLLIQKELKLVRTVTCN